MQSITEAHNLRIATEVALIESRQARENYIQGLRDKRSDDELRSLHHNANEAYAACDKAFRALIGERKYSYAS